MVAKGTSDQVPSGRLARVGKSCLRTEMEMENDNGIEVEMEMEMEMRRTIEAVHTPGLCRTRLFLYCQGKGRGDPCISHPLLRLLYT